MIKAVTFDLWNTLISDRNYDDLRIRCLAKILSQQSIIKDYNEISEAISAAHERAHKVWEKENYRYVSVDERLEYLLENLKVNLPKNLKLSIVKEFRETILRNPPSLVEGVQEVLESLKPDYKLGIICDTGITPGNILRIILERAQILGFFEVTVFSDEVGYNKPHRHMFETALKELRVETSEAIHVGDLLQTDVAGAKAMGMKAVWFNRGGLVKTDQCAPDFEVDALTQLTHILKEIR